MTVQNGIQHLVNEAQLHSQDYESFRQYGAKHELKTVGNVTESMFYSFAEQTWFWTLINDFLTKYTNLNGEDAMNVTNWITHDTYHANYNTKKTFIGEF